MAQQLYGKNREEAYAPSYGHKQSPKEPVFINYYPSGNTNNPQRLVAQVETVTREFVRNLGAVKEPIKENLNHHGDGGSQLRREDEFVNRIRDETMKATADFNNASRIIEPKVLSTNHDQLQWSRGNGSFTEPPELADPNHPRKVAELMSRVSNWRGVNGSDYRRAKPLISTTTSSASASASDGYNNLGYDQTRISYGGDVAKRASLANGSYDYNGNRRAADDVYHTRRNDMMNQQAPSALAQQVRHAEAPRVTTYGNGYNNSGNRIYTGNQPQPAAEYGKSGGYSSTVITSIDAVAKYKGSFVPLMTTGEQRKPNLLQNI